MSAPKIAAAAAVAGLASAISTAAAPTAGADVVAYLVNVTVRPGYAFTSAQDAIDYGQQLCHRVAESRPYADIVATVNADLSTDDEFQASYLIAQAVNELCPAEIWALRSSAAGYGPSVPAHHAPMEPNP